MTQALEEAAILLPPASPSEGERMGGPALADSSSSPLPRVTPSTHTELWPDPWETTPAPSTQHCSPSPPHYSCLQDQPEGDMGRWSVPREDGGQRGMEWSGLGLGLRQTPEEVQI